MRLVIRFPMSSRIRVPLLLNFLRLDHDERHIPISRQALSEVLSSRPRAHCSLPLNQPPTWIDNAPACASAHAAVEIDVDTEQRRNMVRSYLHLTFLSIVAVPALVDIMLLTTTGKGLCLSVFMTADEQQSAT